MKKLEYLTIVVVILYTFSSEAVKIVDSNDFHNILQHYGYGHQVYGDGATEAANEESEKANCDTRRDQWGGRFFKMGVWGADERRPLEVDEASLPKELRLTREEKRQLAAVAPVTCEGNTTVGTGTGFIIDIDKLGAKRHRNYDIVATASHVMFDKDTGEKRSCRFFPNPNNYDESYIMEPVACGSEKSGTITDGVNDTDWCYARIRKISGTYGKLEVDFSDKFDWKDHERDRSKFLSGGWRPDRLKMEFSLNCSPDDKTKYPGLIASGPRLGRDYSRLVIGDCDEDPGTSGGPFIERQGNKLKAFAIIKGDIGEPKRGEYNPNQARGNLYTKFTSEMKRELLKVISRFDSI